MNLKITKHLNGFGLYTKNIKMELTEKSYNVDWIHPTRTETSEEVM